jgi:DNA excision repair protein ERCC-1
MLADLPTGTTFASEESAGSLMATRPVQPPVNRPSGGGGNTIKVNNCQRGNPVLDHLKNIPWQWEDIVPDYQMGATTCALYLSLKYHRLHPDYLARRIEKLGPMFNLRVVLVHCDVVSRVEKWITTRRLSGASQSMKRI